MLPSTARPGVVGEKKGVLLKYHKKSKVKNRVLPAFVAPALHVAFFFWAFNNARVQNPGSKLKKSLGLICVAPACLHSQRPAFDPSKKKFIWTLPQPPPSLSFLLLTYKSDSLDRNCLGPTSFHRAIGKEGTQLYLDLGRNLQVKLPTFIPSS